MTERPRVLKRGSAGNRIARTAEDVLLDEAQASGDDPYVLAVAEEAPVQQVAVPRGRVVRANEARVSRHVAEFDHKELLERFAARDESRRPKPAAEEEPVLTLEAQKAALDAAWQERLDRAVAAAREEAYAQGQADASVTLTAEFEEAHTALSKDVCKIRDEWNRTLEESTPLIAELAFEIAQTVLDTPLSPMIKTVSARALTEAVEQLVGGASIEVYLHPVDFLRIQESGLAEQLESLHAGIRWEPRSEMKPGDWAVQSPMGAIRRLEAELLATLRSRLGLLAVAEKQSGDGGHGRSAAPAVDGTPR